MKPGECLLLAQSGHFAAEFQCPLLGVKRTAVLERLARSNAAHWGTHIRSRNRKRSDDAVAVPRSFVAAIRALAT